jgi:hypothetical protein
MVSDAEDLSTKKKMNSQGWYERAKIDRMLDDFEKFYAEIEEI